MQTTNQMLECLWEGVDGKEKKMLPLLSISLKGFTCYPVIEFVMKQSKSRSQNIQRLTHLSSVESQEDWLIFKKSSF